MNANPFRYSGKLYLIPTTLGSGAPLAVLPARVPQILDLLEDLIVENEKTSRAHIKKLLPQKDQQRLRIHSLNKYTEISELPEFLQACRDGRDMGLLSEAGCPGVADPGAEVVRLAHHQGIQVVPLVGPSSILLAMMGSGMNGQQFCFNGYLPIDKKARRQQLRQFERTSGEKAQAQVFIETPYRNNRLLEDLIQILHPQTLLCVACDLTLSTEFIVTKPVSEWKKATPDLHKRPTIFILQQDL